MDNNTILNQRWKYTNDKLKEYLKTYKKISRKTQDKIQDIFNDVDYEYMDLNKPILRKQRKKLLRIVDEWKENNLLDGYFGFKANELIKKRYISNEDMLDILLWGAYVEERRSLDEYERTLFIEVGTDLYNQGRKEIKPKKEKRRASLTWAYIWSLLTLPNINGNKWTTYIEASLLTYAQEIKRQTMICLQQLKELNIDDDIFQNIIRKQQNRYLSINNGKYSGALENQIVEVANQSLLKAGEDTKNKNLQVRFIAEIDERTTPMCESMDNMLFYVNNWNTYQRYSAGDGRIVNYKTFGLEVGANCPPIGNHYHYCRSTLTYQINNKNIELLAEYNQLRKIIPTEIPDTLEKYADLRYNEDGFYEQIKDKEEVGKHYNKQYEIRNKNHILEHISFRTYYNGYSFTRDDLSRINIDGLGEIKLSTHAYDRIIERNVELSEIIEVLKTKPSYNVKNQSINYRNDIIELAIGERTRDIATIIKFKE